MKYSFLFSLFSVILLSSFFVEQTLAAHDINHGCKDIIGCGPPESKQVLIFVVLLFFSVMLVYFISSLNIHYLPESIAIVVYGVVFGVIDKYTSSHIMDNVSLFDSDKFFLFLLPIIIFETGFSLPQSDFFRNLLPILMLAIFGTLISFILTGFGVYLMGFLGVSLPISLREGLILGSVGCSTDPVATLAIFKALDVEPLLFILVLGESILNDAISIIAFKSVLTYGVSEIWKPVLIFFGVVFGSVFIGVATILILSITLKLFDIGKYPAVETIFIIIFSFISYHISDSIGLSGIVAAFFSGMTMSHYGYRGLSEETKHTISQLYRTGAFIGETIAFIYIGISLPIHEFHVNVPMIAWTLFFFLFSRAFSIFPIFFILNNLKLKKQPYVSLAIQTVIWFSGLRGAISFSLSLSPALDDFPNGKHIQTTILICVYITLFVFGMGTYPLLKILKIKTNQREQTLESINTMHIDDDTKIGKLGSMIRTIDDKITQYFSRPAPPPPLLREEEEEDEKISSDEENSHTNFEYYQTVKLDNDI
ncbi:hypothetical protein CYY_002204 [Polysphondylium violaceum]|uniref:Sodium/hydrogen exchanger n=1 Tax=Polysphondylium violaceum TaxID=133409 RepID=A0A8J4PYE8_9MYCE|nr:hypothetical protein CYY_002204 [Polysphondylium violaceum]